MADGFEQGRARLIQSSMLIDKGAQDGGVATRVEAILTGTLIISPFFFFFFFYFYCFLFIYFSLIFFPFGGDIVIKIHLFASSFLFHLLRNIHT